MLCISIVAEPTHYKKSIRQKLKIFLQTHISPKQKMVCKRCYFPKEVHTKLLVEDLDKSWSVTTHHLARFPLVTGLDTGTNFYKLCIECKASELYINKDFIGQVQSFKIGTMMLSHTECTVYCTTVSHITHIHTRSLTPAPVNCLNGLM